MRGLISIGLVVLFLTTVLIPVQDGRSEPSEPIIEFESPFVSFRFLRNSQNIESNRFNSLTDIYFYIGILELTGDLAAMDKDEKDDITAIVQSFQNSDGGFGDWYRDRSKAGSTRIAMETLEKLGARPLNEASAVEFLGRLQITGLIQGNGGFRSSLKESDSDVSSTYNVIRSLDILGANVPNRVDVVEYLKDHQNTDGGFGLQTNRKAGIFWDSTAIHTHRGILALDILGEEPDFMDEAESFLTNLQTAEGGFSNIPEDLGKISYTYNSVFSLSTLGVQIPRTQDIGEFIMNNQMGNGGFIEFNLDNKEGLHTTYWAIRTLDHLGITFDKGKVSGFAYDFLAGRKDGGFGNYPGLGSNVRFTFDAVSALNLIGREPYDIDASVDFILSLRNSDGGFGEGGQSNIETTYRAVLTLNSAGVEVPRSDMIVSYVIKSQNEDGGFGFAKNFVSRGSYTYRALRTLEILGYGPVNKDGAVSYLKTLQNDDGGFGNYIGEDDSDLGSTYRALRGLSILGHSPNDVNEAEDFILTSRNQNGGFRRSPHDTTAPSNFSRSIFTYNAILGLHFLGRSLVDREPTYEFIISLRNPDLGYGDQAFFTSTVSSTFTSLWSLFYLFPEVYDSPPQLLDGKASIPATPQDPVRFSVRIADSQGQSPEYVHILLDHYLYTMEPDMISESRAMDTDESGIVYSFDRQLAIGTHSYQFIASDGLIMNTSQEMVLVMESSGKEPTVTIGVDSMEGDRYTLFTFTTVYNDPDGDPPSLIQLEVDRFSWHTMTPMGNNAYSVTLNMQPGQHSVRVKASDGENLVYSDTLGGPFVYSLNASRPEWETFLNIQHLILKNYGITISFRDVTLDSRSGDLVWKVNVDEDTEVYVNYEGTGIIEDKDEGRDFRFIAAAFTTMVLIVVLATMAIITFKKRDIKDA